MFAQCDATAFIRAAQTISPFNTATDGSDLRQLVMAFAATYDSGEAVQPVWSDDEAQFRELLRGYDYQRFDWGVIWLSAIATDVEERKASPCGACACDEY